MTTGSMWLPVQLGPGVFGPNLFRRNGLNERERLPQEVLGMAEFTLITEDWNVFRVPSLRNAALMAPYLHDGSVSDLASLLKAYKEKRSPDLSDKELGLEAFLESLSDPQPIFPQGLKISYFLRHML